jgi:hypothetical protein
MVTASDRENMNWKVLIGRGQISSGDTPSVAHDALNSFNACAVSNPVVKAWPVNLFPLSTCSRGAPLAFFVIASEFEFDAI